MNSEYRSMMELARICHEAGGKRSGYASIPMPLLYMGVPIAQFVNRFRDAPSSFTRHSLRAVDSQLTVDISKITLYTPSKKRC